MHFDLIQTVCYAVSSACFLKAHSVIEFFRAGIVFKDPYPIGKYGRMRMNYLKEHRPVIYNQLILSGKLYAHLGEIEQTCQERLEHMIQQMKKAEGITEALKAEDQMEWADEQRS